jgi:phage FluMu protein Com
MDYLIIFLILYIVLYRVVWSKISHFCIHKYIITYEKKSWYIKYVKKKCTKCGKEIERIYEEHPTSIICKTEDYE